MALPGYYVSPEQMMKDKSSYARQMISRGNPVVALEYEAGILFVSENASATLHKISEIYDCIAFAGLGKFNEFETLRMHGIRQADVRGYSYSRDDVTARGLANSYSQILGQIFSEAMKPFEVEILVAAIGNQPEDSEMYHILFDGSVAGKRDFVAMGGASEVLDEFLSANYEAQTSLSDALKLAIRALSETSEDEIQVNDLEVAVLDRGRDRRKFHRLGDEEVQSALA